MIYSTGIVAYRFFEPQADYTHQNKDSYISYASLHDYIIATGESSIHYLFFFSGYSKDSLYVQTTVLNDVEQTTGLDLDTLIEIVDLSELNPEDIPLTLANDWGLSNFPAFVAVTVEDSKIKVLNKLEWTDDNPINKSSLENWLSENELYNNGKFRRKSNHK